MIGTVTTKARPFTLTMLGTDTIYSPELKSTAKKSQKEYYPKGETLSVVSTLIQIAHAPKRNRSNSYPYQAEEIVVVNGPDTQGSNVGDKIALGLAALLKAISHGQTTLNIISHSRGAVESILIAHEMTEIQKLIGLCGSFDELLARLSEQQLSRVKSKTSNTPDIIKMLSAQLPEAKAERDVLFLGLKNNCSEASINFFGIDPVPGDVFPITWYDERFYTLPGIIKNAEIYYYENERSYRGFTPIYSEASNPSQNISHHSMPGHHGTGSSGNDRPQKGKKNSSQYTKTTHVQKLFLYKTLEFLTRHGVAFKDGEELFQKHRALGKKYVVMGIKKNDDMSIDISALDYPAIYRKLYTKIAANKDAYAAYNRTHYALMGLTSQRKVLRKGHQYGSFNEIFSENDGYVNEEHYRLMQDYFFQKFNLDAPENHSLEALVRRAHEVLVSNIKVMSSTSQSGFVIIDAPVSVLDNESVRKDVLDAFNVLIHRVSQQYITDVWSTPQKQEEKKALMEAIKEILHSFDALSKTDNPITQEFIGKIFQMSLNGITHTVKQEYKNLLQEIGRLQAPVEDQLRVFFDGLIAQGSSTNNGSKSDHKIKKIMASDEFIALADHPVEAKIAFLRQHLEELLPKGDLQLQLTALFEEEFGAKLEDFEKVHHRIQIFIKDLGNLAQLAPTEKHYFDQCELTLRQKMGSIIDVAAKKFYEKNRFSELPKSAPKGSFSELVKCSVVYKYGVEEQELQELQGVIEQTNNVLRRENDLLKAAINDKREAQYLLLIENKLLPLTRNYLKKLQVSRSTDEKKEAKISALRLLLLHLTDTQAHCNPSERVRAFYTQLDQSEAVLKAHRDPAWKRYVRTAVVSAGILITGILPGLIALAVYVQMGTKVGRSPLFWRSAGAGVVDELKSAKAPDEDVDGLPSLSS